MAKQQSLSARMKSLWVRAFGNKHVRLAHDVQSRVTEFRSQFMKHHLEQKARHATSGTDEMPDRWREVSVADFLRFIEATKTPETAATLPDMAWGVLQEATERIAADAKKLFPSDIDALTAFMQPDEDTAKVTLADLYLRKKAQDDATEALRVRNMKVAGTPME